MFLFFFFFSGLSTFFTFLVNFPFPAAFVLFLCLLLSFFLSVLNLLLHSFLLSPALNPVGKPELDLGLVELLGLGNQVCEARVLPSGVSLRYSYSGFLALTRLFLLFFFFSGLSTFFTFLVNFPFLAAFVLFLCLLLSFFLSVLNLLLHSFLLSPFLQSPADSLTSLCRRRSF